MQQKFVVKTNTFTGPLELLLQLIEKRKLFIGDIALAEVTDDYLEHIKELQEFPVRAVANFLVVAATLVLIKSRSLLPYLELTEEETTDIQDLQRRLHLYKEIQELGRHVQERFGKRMLFAREPFTLTDPIFAPHKEITIENVYMSASDLIAAFPSVEHIPHTVVEKVVSLEKMIDTLTSRVKDSMEMSFKKFADAEGTVDREKKLNVIVSFLALLELVKENIIAVKQTHAFEDIAIAKSFTHDN